MVGDKTNMMKTAALRMLIDIIANKPVNEESREDCPDVPGYFKANPVEHDQAQNIWAALSATYFAGGRTTIDGVIRKATTVAPANTNVKRDWGRRFPGSI